MTQEEFEQSVWMHVYAPAIWHGDARIMGTRAALTGLRDAIDRVLSSGMDQHCEGIVRDGEGYRLKVSIRSYAGLKNEPLPYTDEIANPTNS